MLTSVMSVVVLLATESLDFGRFLHGSSSLIAHIGSQNLALVPAIFLAEIIQFHYNQRFGNRST